MQADAVSLSLRSRSGLSENASSWWSAAADVEAKFERPRVEREAADAGEVGEPTVVALRLFLLTEDIIFLSFLFLFEEIYNT